MRDKDTLFLPEYDDAVDSGGLGEYTNA